MRKFSKKQYLVAGVAAAAVIGLGTGTAIAYWSSSGTGSGSATTGTDGGFGVSLATSGDPLSPNGPTDMVTVTITNNGSGAQQVNSATASVANSDGTAWTSGSCSANDYSVSAVSLTPVDLPAGHQTTGTFTIQMKDTSQPQDDCKNQIVPLYVTVN